MPGIVAARRLVGSLVLAAGGLLSSEGGPSSGPTYVFTRLNERKPG